MSEQLAFGRLVTGLSPWLEREVAGYSLGGNFALRVARRHGDAPLYRIEKRPALQTKQGQWAVIGEGGVVLKRGRELPQVLRVFDSRKFKVVD